MLSAKERLGPRHETREEAPIDVFRFEIAPDLFGSTHHRLLDAFEEEEEEEAGVVLAEKKERGFLESGFLSIKLLGNRAESESESEFLNWDDIPLGDPVDGLKLSDLMDYDPLAVDADEEETNCPGKKFPVAAATKVDDIWGRIYTRRNVEYQKKCEEIEASEDENATFPSYPLKILPEATGICVMRGFCHHREYKTHDTSTARSTLGLRDPRLMLQIFAMHLSISESYSYPVSVYGIVAVRDALEPLRNLLFNRPCRDDAFMVDQDPLTLPLCSPRRGMYLVRDRALLEVDLWVKEEGDGSSDKQLLSLYAEFEGMYQLDEMLDGEVSSDLGSLVIDYLLLDESVEAVIQVFAKIDCPHHVRFTAFTSGFDGEIVLFDDKFSGNGKLFQYVVAVKAEGKLDICLKLEESLFWWTFQEGAVGAVRFPDDSVLNYGQFEVTVLFAPKKFTMDN
ncbi:hypothetical protein ACQJBY_015044 [Aegilops geniculata]